MEEENLTNRKKIKRVLRGASGLSQSVLSINIAPDKIIEERREICRNCEYAVSPKSKPDKKVKCSLCGCLINHKIRLRKEKCPDKRWGRIR